MLRGGDSTATFKTFQKTSTSKKKKDKPEGTESANSSRRKVKKGSAVSHALQLQVFMNSLPWGLTDRHHKFPKSHLRSLGGIAGHRPNGNTSSTALLPYPEPGHARCLQRGGTGTAWGQCGDSCSSSGHCSHCCIHCT